MNVKLQRMNEAKGLGRKAQGSKNCILYRGPLTLCLEPFILALCLNILAPPNAHGILDRRDFVSSTCIWSRLWRDYFFIPFSDFLQGHLM